MSRGSTHLEADWPGFHLDDYHWLIRGGMTRRDARHATQNQIALTRARLAAAEPTAQASAAVGEPGVSTRSRFPSILLCRRSSTEDAT